ncbi:hypothetical protein DB30_05465 [Enhygromyxa salina]|uniref:SpoIIAA-like protein n=1 Tax=Enhygromyxa salina TaxID=215803 RepID=A0A0C2CX37_9BACT|nr:STAS/SEC14 domain-containing protein [Enhygromyxa salina]KIG15591.1 hypothetical protein DB30_05465 [Enhygromyxa salina]
MEAKIVGRTRLATVGSNTLHLQWHGDIGAAEVTAIEAYSAALRQELGGDAQVYALVEIGDDVGISRDARPGIGTLAREQPWAATALVGARYEVKVLIELTLNATRLLTKAVHDVAFFDTNAEARAWLAERGAC